MEGKKDLPNQPARKKNQRLVFFRRAREVISVRVSGRLQRGGGELSTKKAFAAVEMHTYINKSIESSSNGMKSYTSHNSLHTQEKEQEQSLLDIVVSL